MTGISSWRRRAALSAACAAVMLGSCGRSPEKAPTAIAPEVAVIKVEPQPFTVADELPGRVVAYRTAEIRPQVGGIIQRRLFEQGSEVRAGQALFQISAAPFRADANGAAATLQRAQAALLRTRTQAERLRPLVEADAISRQSYDDAVAARAQAAAEVSQARADLQRKNLDLGFATVTTPISGRIDQAVVTEGALAVAGDNSALAIVQQIDQVYVDVRQPASRLEELRRVASGSAGAAAPVQILDADGRPYDVLGRLLFSGINVDPGTGEVVARVLVQNPQRILLPGMFVRARLPRLTFVNATSLPQQAIARDARGRANVSIVDSQGRVRARPVTIGAELDGQAIVTAGLRAGDVVIVEGQDRVRPKTPVKVVPWQMPRSTDKR